MIWMQAILAAWWVELAAWHAHLIKQNRPIQHGWWALLAAAIIAGATMLYAPDHRWLQIVLFATAQAALRLVVFNVALNLFRGLSWNYTSKSTTSIIDRLETRLFGGRAWIVEIILATLFITLQFFI